ncbi:MAG: hypothetical protein GY821_10640 [Gammaproteobacteria bacterium]|nr:hypothetical protein [Gammaproteobacteria bacterium]
MISLAGHLLIAMPHLDDDFFSQAVIYLYKHDEDGAAGFIVNKTLNVKAKELLELENVDIEINDNTLILAGGPVEPDHLLALYRDIPAKEPTRTFIISQQELSTLPVNNLNSNINLFLGYSQWQPAQLESELQNNCWLIAPGSDEIIYDVPLPYRYKTSLKLIGVDSRKLVPGVVGHA